LVGAYYYRFRLTELSMRVACCYTIQHVAHSGRVQ
jgi:hypothetical protein